MKKVGIIGGSGYTAGELMRLLVHHPEVIIDFIYSRTNPGKPVAAVHPDLVEHHLLEFTDEPLSDVDILFLCLGHGKSAAFLEDFEVSDDTLIIDLSRDFRSKDHAPVQGRTFTYGLPELNRNALLKSKSIANPGCFATAIQLALLPLAQAGKLNDEVHIHAITGSTGAGAIPSATTHFSWRNNNVSWYKPFVHQHEAEIVQSLQQNGATPNLRFLPLRGDFPRGIFATSYIKFEDSEEQAREIYDAFYADSPFTSRVEAPIHLKQVVNSNHCHIHLHKHEDILLITSALDNLIKGASGQAVENMNLAQRWAPDLGLKLKASVY